MATYERLDYGSDDGSQIGGASTDKFAFFGKAPVSPSSINNLSTGVADVSTTLSTLVVALKANGIIL
jgi:hypothetical protein